MTAGDFIVTWGPLIILILVWVFVMWQVRKTNDGAAAVERSITSNDRLTEAITELTGQVRENNETLRNLQQTISAADRPN